MQISTSGPRGKGMKHQLWVSGGQRSEQSETDHNNPFWRDFSRTLRRILTETVRHILPRMLFMSQL